MYVRRSDSVGLGRDRFSASVPSWRVATAGEMACAHAPPSLETPAVSTSYINAPSTRSGSRSRLFTSICWRSRRCVPVPVPAPVPVPGVHTRLEMFAAAESGASSAVAFGATWLPSYQSLPLPLTHCTALHCAALHCTALHWLCCRIRVWTAQSRAGWRMANGPLATMSLHCTRSCTC